MRRIAVRRKWFIAVAISVCVMAVVAIVLHGKNGVNKRHMATMMGEIVIGQTAVEAKRVVEMHKTAGMDLILTSPNEWLVTMPPEFGARDWVFLISLDGDGRIAHLAIRYADNRSWKPKDAPNDKSYK